MKKKTAVLILLSLLLALFLSGCGAQGQLKGIYRSEDGKTTLVFDTVLYLVTEEDVGILSYKYNPDAQKLYVGDETLEYSLSEDGSSLTFGSDRFEKVRGSFALTWRLVKESAVQYIQAAGFLKWIVLPINRYGLQSVGHYGVGGAIAADILIVIVLIIVGVIGESVSTGGRRR